jgi:hypothetical protein
MVLRSNACPVPLFRYPVVPLVLQITAPPHDLKFSPKVMMLAARLRHGENAQSRDHASAKANPAVAKLGHWSHGSTSVGPR